MDVKTLPPYLQESIEQLQANLDNKLRVDLYVDDLDGSINAAFYGGDITKEQAMELRQTYFGTTDGETLELHPIDG